MSCQNRGLVEIEYVITVIYDNDPCKCPNTIIRICRTVIEDKTTVLLLPYEQRNHYSYRMNTCLHVASYTPNTIDSRRQLCIEYMQKFCNIQTHIRTRYSKCILNKLLYVKDSSINFIVTIVDICHYVTLTVFLI